jgi:hypothetical protein
VNIIGESRRAFDYAQVSSHISRRKQAEMASAGGYDRDRLTEDGCTSGRFSSSTEHAEIQACLSSHAGHQSQAIRTRSERLTEIGSFCLQAPSPPQADHRADERPSPCPRHSPDSRIEARPGAPFEARPWQAPSTRGLASVSGLVAPCRDRSGRQTFRCRPWRGPG